MEEHREVQNLCVVVWALFESVTTSAQSIFTAISSIYFYFYYSKCDEMDAELLKEPIV